MIFALLAGLFWYRCYYPHRLRDALSPVCWIFFWKKVKTVLFCARIGVERFEKWTTGTLYFLWNLSLEVTPVFSGLVKYGTWCFPGPAAEPVRTACMAAGLWPITASSQPGNSRLQTWFWLVSAAWPAQSCAVLSQVFVKQGRYRHSSLRLAAPLPRLGLAEALEVLAMLCWVYNDYLLKFKILSRRLKQIMLTYMATVTSQDGWV